MIGGINDGGNYLNSMERFDPREGNRCVPMKAMKESRDGAAASEHKGLIYATGGLNTNGGSDTVEMFVFVFSLFIAILLIFFLI